MLLLHSHSGDQTDKACVLHSQSMPLVCHIVEYQNVVDTYSPFSHSQFAMHFCLVWLVSVHVLPPLHSHNSPLVKVTVTYGLFKPVGFPDDTKVVVDCKFRKKFVMTLRLFINSNVVCKIEMMDLLDWLLLKICAKLSVYVTIYFLFHIQVLFSVEICQVVSKDHQTKTMHSIYTLQWLPLEV